MLAPWLKNADLLARRVEVGMLWINIPAMPSAAMPFGGIKDSGYGSEGGPEALECLPQCALGGGDERLSVMGVAVQRRDAGIHRVT